MNVMDPRKSAAKYYDLAPPPFDDVPFYRDRIPTSTASVLELGCGTGRVLVPLARRCGYIHGIDHSSEMLNICRERLKEARVSCDRAAVELGDVTKLDLGRPFELIIAPYRVFQNLATDAEVEGFLDGVRQYLADTGSCVLNVFHPWPMDKLKAAWGKEEEQFCWEKVGEDGRITCHERRSHIDASQQTLYPEAVYRHYRGDELVDETVMKFCMRCYYPEQFRTLIIDRGFKIVEQAGGYDGEPYGQGNELILRFTKE